MNPDREEIRFTSNMRVQPSRYLLKVADAMGRSQEDDLAKLADASKHPWIVRTANLELERRKNMEASE